MTLYLRSLISFAFLGTALPLTVSAQLNFVQRGQIVATAPRCQSLRADAPAWSTSLTSFHKLDGALGSIPNSSTFPSTATGFDPGNAGTVVNPKGTLAYSPGRFAQSVAFNGEPDDYLDLGDHANNTDLASAPGSVMLWLNQSVLHAGGLIYKSNNNGNAGWMLFVRPADDGKSTTEYYFAFFSVFSTTNLKVETSNFKFVGNVWNQLIVTWDGTADGSKVRFYLNGELLPIHYPGDGVGTKGSDTGYSMRIGAPGAGMTNGVGAFKGKIDEVAFWRKELNLREIRSLYFMQKCRE